MQVATTRTLMSGEAFQQLCDVYCGSHYDLHRNPVIATQTAKHLDIDGLVCEWDNPRLLFCYSCALKKLLSKLSLLRNQFVLVSHNEDDNVTAEYLVLADSPLVIRWYAQNLMFDHPKARLIPIGIANSMWPHGSVAMLTRAMDHPSTKEDRVHFNFSTWTNPTERYQCIATLEGKGLRFTPFQPHEAYLSDLSRCKFAICPPGNGIDCHRTWECFYLRVIPIILRSIFTEALSRLLPCVLLDSWDAFHPDIVLQYDALVAVLHQNHRFIDFNHYKDEIESMLHREAGKESRPVASNIHADC